jgi:hypothetical protein
MQSFDQRKTIELLKNNSDWILWISDIPALHYFKIKAAKLYIDKNIRKENESMN